MAKAIRLEIPDASTLKAGKAAFKVLPAGIELHRIHPLRFGSTAFNDTNLGNARFSPIHDGTGNVIPTIYAGQSFECATCEIILRCPEVPSVDHRTGLPTFHIVFPADYRAHGHSVLRTLADLNLVDVTTSGQRKIGVNHSALLVGTRLHYPETRAWAERIHAEIPEAQGLYYNSVQWGEFAIVLFGDRVAADALTHVSTTAVSDPHCHEQIRRLADSLSIEYFDV